VDFVGDLEDAPAIRAPMFFTGAALLEGVAAVAREASQAGRVAGDYASLGHVARHYSP
jgi:hypothetical protein